MKMINTKNFKLLAILSSCLIMSACASIAGDNNRTVNVTSRPAGAKVYVDNQEYGVTPTQITLPSNIYSGKVVTVKKPGFRAQTRVVNPKFQAIAVANVLFWPGFIVDAVTGNLVKINPQDTNLNYQLIPA